MQNPEPISLLLTLLTYFYTQFKNVINMETIFPDLPPPPCESDCEPDDWYPYQGQIKFEVADFLYHQNQISASDIDTLLNLWGASAATQGGAPLFQNH